MIGASCTSVFKKVLVAAMNDYKIERDPDNLKHVTVDANFVCDGFCTGRLSVGQITETCIACHDCGRPLSATFVDKYMRACDDTDY